MEEMEENDICAKAKSFLVEESIPLPRIVFRELYSQAMKLSGFGLGGILVLSSKKAGAKFADYLKTHIIEDVNDLSIANCIISTIEAYNQKVMDYEVHDGGITITISNSVFADGMTSRKPVCLPLAGIIAGMLEEFTASVWETKEIKCKACGDEFCVFKLKRK